jgi:hypothetical protein
MEEAKGLLIKRPTGCYVVLTGFRTPLSNKRSTPVKVLFLCTEVRLIPEIFNEL